MLLLPLIVSGASRRLEDASCPCISTSSVHTGGTLTVTLAGVDYSYPAAYGLSNCTAHGASLPPYCSRGADSPEWCADSWCCTPLAQPRVPPLPSVRACDKRQRQSPVPPLPGGLTRDSGCRRRR